MNAASSGVILDRGTSILLVDYEAEALASFAETPGHFRGPPLALSSWSGGEGAELD